MKARILLTQDCPRKCDGCCNNHDIFNPYGLSDVRQLLEFDTVMLTGGEPMLYPDKVEEFLDYLDNACYMRTKYLYSAYYNPKHREQWVHILRRLDGLHYTLHAECSDADIEFLQELSYLLQFAEFERKSLRLAIDKRVYDRYDLSNIDFSGWNVVRKMEWKPECPLPEGEVLYLWEW